ncbi:hypothetical protein [Sphingomonas sp.]|uniref:hypothetical protein n=1 Tax=Sphingomonas sp. TaxID=28214 RepID=UPI002DF450CF|nr:hypothetical protein [Sphingomonas sp.]
MLLFGLAPAQEQPASPTKEIVLPPVAPSAERRSKRLSLSAWALIRSDISPGLAAAGQLGGSQVGIRARYAVADQVHFAARLSSPTGSSKGKEAAVAADLQPFEAVPITLTVERRIGLDRGGRNAFGIGVFGGFDRQVASRTAIDGYAQAGVVGLKSRDAYVDGAVRAERQVASIGKMRIGAGAGLWGGAQPGASRLDVGPQVVGHAPVGQLNVRLGAEWRQRVAGNAGPGSGPALSLGADF